MARNCVRGAKMVYEYCAYGSPRWCGKIICAPTAEDAPVLQQLLERGINNGVEDLEIVDAKWIKEREPLVDVHSALYSPNTGVADYGAMARHIAKEINDSGRGLVQLQYEVREAKHVDQDAEGHSTDKGKSTHPVEVTGCEPGQKGPT